MFNHCHRQFRPVEVLYLFSNDNFTNRVLKIGVCPECDKTLARLMEVRRVDSVQFDTVFTGGKATKLIDECLKDIDYKSTDILPTKGSPFGFRYGVNKQRINKKTGEVTIMQEACDFYGNKEVVKQETHIIG